MPRELADRLIRERRQQTTQLLFAERRKAERRKLITNARVNHWFARFHDARRENGNASFNL